MESPVVAMTSPTGSRQNNRATNPGRPLPLAQSGSNGKLMILHHFTNPNHHLSGTTRAEDETVERRSQSLATQKGCAGGGGFTLVELIVVMFLLAGVLSIVAPNLSRFFQNRYVIEEARRMHAVIRHAQQQAIATGFPVTVWLEPDENRFGFQIQNPFKQRGVQNTLYSEDPRSVYTLKSEIRMLVNPNEMDQATARYLIRFMPDGSIDASSLQMIQLVRALSPTEDFIYIVQSQMKSAYDIQKLAPAYNAGAQQTW
jgi:prepilin-type N-terminal cleavage/methylation domain-containing protein